MAFCIYCGGTAKSEEHWLPRALGAIRNIQLLKDRLCETCNRELGHELDEELARTGPTGFFKAAQGIKGRAKHTEVNPFLYRGMSADQPTQLTMPAPHGEYEILAEAYWHKGRGKTTSRALRQLVFKKSDGQVACVPFNRAWTAEHIKSAVRERHLQDATLVEVYLGHDEEVLPDLEMRKLLTEALGNFSATCWGGEEQDGIVKTVKLAAGISTKYIRAVAKVGFHYFLHTSNRFRGDEPVFEPLRHFIRRGKGNSKDFVELATPQFIPALRNRMVPEQMSHFFVSDVSGRVVTSRVQFFVGPENLPPPSLIRLGTLSQVESRAISCHRVRYYIEKIDGYDGEVENIEVFGAIP